MKLVINTCYGGFSLSDEAMRFIANEMGINLWVEPDPQFNTLTNYWTVPPEARPKPVVNDDWYYMSDAERTAHNKAYEASQLSTHDMDRTSRHLIKAVETLGERANGGCADLKVVEIPDGISWELDEYDGIETVRETHRSWC